MCGKLKVFAVERVKLALFFVHVGYRGSTAGAYIDVTIFWFHCLAWYVREERPRVSV